MQRLIDLYDSFKDVYIQAVQREIMVHGWPVTFEPPIHIKIDKDAGIFFLDILEVSWEWSNSCSVHIKETDPDGLATEYWKPLEKMEFGYLRAIANRL